MWMSDNGVSRVTISKGRRSLSATSAARSTSEREVPAAMLATVPIEQGQITMPPAMELPEAGAAPRSSSLYTVTSPSNRFSPTACRSPSRSATSLSVRSRRNPCDDTISDTRRAVFAHVLRLIMHKVAGFREASGD